MIHSVQLQPRTALTRRRRVIALLCACIATAFMVHSAPARADVVVGCTHNSSYLNGEHMHLAGLMTGCPYGTLTITSEYYYNGYRVPVNSHTCMNTTGCSIPTTDTYACFAPGSYVLRIKGQHGNATDYADVDVVLGNAVTQANPACAAAYARYANETTAQIADDMAQQMAADQTVTPALPTS